MKIILIRKMDKTKDLQTLHITLKIYKTLHIKLNIYKTGISPLTANNNEKQEKYLTHLISICLHNEHSMFRLYLVINLQIPDFKWVFVAHFLVLTEYMCL
jgi:hypothetical protein